MTSRVCIDASLVLRWLLPTEQDAAADSLLEAWDNAGIELASTPLLDTEIASAIRRHVYFRLLAPEQGERAYRFYRDIGVVILNPPELARTAWNLAVEYNQTLTYDMQYVAAAEIENCELWTADRRLANLVQGKRSWVRWLGDYRPQTVAATQTPKQETVPKRDDTPRLDDPGLWRRI